MDRSILRLPDPASCPPHGERRRSVRHKLHTPVYVSFNVPESGTVVDLSELLNLHENGFAVQTAVPAGTQRNGQLEVNRAVLFRLDLPETKKIVCGSGEVIWIDDTGRAGIRFSSLPGDSRQTLKEWLFANLLVASTLHAARAGQLAHRPENESSACDTSADEAVAPDSPRADDSGAPTPMLVTMPIMVPVPEPPPDEPVAALPDRSGWLSALDDVRREVRQVQDRHSNDRHSNDRRIEDRDIVRRGIGDDKESVLQLITARAMNLTGATGAALALLTAGRMICRASSGDPAPPLGSEVDVRSGLSGECIRSGLVVTCEDPGRDSRADPEVCRVLGIGSFMAAPIFTDFRVVGLLEIFSPHSRSFSAVHGSILERLVELIPNIEKNNLDEKKIEPDTTDPHGLETNASEVPEAVAAECEPANPAPIMEDGRPRPSNAIGATNLAAEACIAKPTPAILPEETDLSDDKTTALEAPRRPHLAHLALFVVVLGTIAMVIGYLLAPTIQKHWGAQGARSSNTELGASSLPTSYASLQNAADRQGHPISPADLRKLADQGDADAQWQLGILYHDGGVVPKDDAQAVQWFERAAEQGYVRAQSTLGAYYWAGRGVPQDLTKAYFWSQLALAQGDEISKSRLEGLTAQMTPTQVAQARQEAEAWLHSHTQATRPNPGVK